MNLEHINIPAARETCSEYRPPEAGDMAGPGMDSWERTKPDPTLNSEEGPLLFPWESWLWECHQIESHPFGIIFKWLIFKYQYSADFPINHSFRPFPALPPNEMTQEDSEGQWAQVCVEGEGGITVVQLYNCFWQANKPVLVPIMSPGKGTWVWVQVLLSTSDLGFLSSPALK